MRAALGVLVVDDSAVVRQMVTSILERAGMQVMSASDPLIARERMRARRPDVLLLDLELPREDGLTFLRDLMSREPLPVIVLSSLVGPNTEAGLRALEAGAVEIVAKPALGAGKFLADSATQLVRMVQAAAGARIWARPRLPAPGPDTARRLFSTDVVLALGASTGGTEALRYILQSMPPDAPGLVIVQHMPQHYTAAFAQSLDAVCQIEVKEARAGDPVRVGRALIAPGNRHLRVHRSGAHYAVGLDDGPRVEYCRPSADVLLQSVAEACGANAVGAILTGMGSDGADGLLAMRRAGAATLVQDERSSVVFGMPKQAIARGAAEEVVPLDRIPAALLRRASRGAGRGGGK